LIVVRLGKAGALAAVKVGGSILRARPEEEIEHVRKLLPKIANGRKTRYKKQSAART